jgi:hypothetical protein
MILSGWQQPLAHTRSESPWNLLPRPIYRVRALINNVTARVTSRSTAFRCSGPAVLVVCHKGFGDQAACDSGMSK